MSKKINKKLAKLIYKIKTKQIICTVNNDLPVVNSKYHTIYLNLEQINGN